MPIGVPRIIYCWGEELPAQWTDIYNFIFRRRMVFLMQYLDDELCNQICGLLINIHMEDRSKELEKKEMEKSGLFKTSQKQQNPASAQRDSLTGTSNILKSQKNLTGPSFEDLLAADEDLGIEENNTLEQFTLQKITMEWLNWNAQFFDYSDEPYLFYLAEMLSKDFNKGEAKMLYGPSNDNNEMSILMNMFKNIMTDQQSPGSDKGFKNSVALMQFFDKLSYGGKNPNFNKNKNHLDVYSPFRLLANFAAQDYNLKDVNPLVNNSQTKLLELFNNTLKNKTGSSIKNDLKSQNSQGESQNMPKLLMELTQKDFLDKNLTSENILKSSEKGLSQRLLRKEYAQEKNFPLKGQPSALRRKNDIGDTLPINYLDFYSYKDSYNEFKNTQRGTAGQSERTLQ
jgi:hypothetical protein